MTDNVKYIPSVGGVSPADQAKIDNLPTDTTGEITNLQKQIISTGFDRTNPNIWGLGSFDEATRTYTNTPKIGYNIEFWANDVEFIQTTAQSVILPDVTGAYYMYYDNSGVLQYVIESAFPLEAIYEYCLIDLVYWNAEEGVALGGTLPGSERHGIDMSPTTHAYNHRTFKARLDTHGGLQDIEGLTNGGATYTQTTSGAFWDEDIFHSILTQSTHKTIYRKGAAGGWVSLPVNNKVAYDNGGSYHVWNELDGGIWGLSEGGILTDYWVTYFADIPSQENGVITKIMGQTSYSSANNARNGIENDLANMQLNGLPNPEMVFLFAVIVNRNGNLVALSDGSLIYDLRNKVAGSGGGSAETKYAIDIPTDTTNFNQKLSSADTDVQKALETLDVHPSDVSINFLPNTDSSILEGSYKKLVTENFAEGTMTTPAITSSDSANPTSLGFFINDNKALVGFVGEKNITASGHFKLTSAFNRDVAVKFKYYEYDYETNTLNTTELSETSYSSVITNTASYEEKIVTGTIPENEWAETSTVGNTLVIELLAYKTVGVGDNPTLDVKVGSTSPSRTTIDVPTASINHNTIGGVMPSGIDVPDGHINNKYPLVFPNLTTTERDAITSPITSMKIWNTTTLQYESYSGSAWVADSADLSSYALKSNVLELDNTTSFTPDSDYEPATKKYVDDAGGGDTDFTEVVKTADQTLTTTSYVQVTDLYFNMVSGKKYAIEILLNILPAQFGGGDSSSGQDMWLGLSSFRSNEMNRIWEYTDSPNNVGGGRKEYNVITSGDEISTEGIACRTFEFNSAIKRKMSTVIKMEFTATMSIPFGINSKLVYPPSASYCYGSILKGSTIKYKEIT